MDQALYGSMTRLDFSFAHWVIGGGRGAHEIDTGRFRAITSDNGMAPASDRKPHTSTERSRCRRIREAERRAREGKRKSWSIARLARRACSGAIARCGSGGAARGARAVQNPQCRGRWRLADRSLIG